MGPFKLRKSSLLYEGWVEEAGGIIKGSNAAAKLCVGGGPSAEGEDGDHLEACLVPPRQKNRGLLGEEPTPTHARTLSSPTPAVP